jgi:chromosome segregation ATPase
MAELEFRSPMRKLAVFFKRSRDKWKQKSQEAKYEHKLLNRRYGHLKSNHDAWKQACQEAQAKCEHLQARIEHLEAQQQQLQARLDVLSKKGGLLS